MLAPFSLTVSDDMPVLIEKFELLYRGYRRLVDEV